MTTDVFWHNVEDDQVLDRSFPQTFANILSSDISDSLKKRLEELGEYWRLIGLPIDKRDEQVAEIREAVVGQIDKFVKDGKELLNKCRNFNEYKLNEINKILTDLSLQPFSLPKDPMPLMSQNKILQTKYQELLQIKNERMEILEKIESRLERICHLLGINYEPTIFTTDIPNELELKSLSLILKNHEKTLYDRKLQYDSLKSIINKLQSELEYSAENEDEEMILNLVNDEFIFSQCNMTKIMDLHKKLTHLYNNYKDKIEQLMTILEQLYNRLDVPLNERTPCVVGTFLEQEHYLKNEIAKYEIIKKNSIEKIIKSIRNEISALLRKCMVTRFDENLLESQEYNEELLERLELEFERLKKFYESYEVIFQKFKEWEDSLERLVELEKKSLDPNRFTNRGGTLLQNERDRKMLNKKLPRLEKDIRSLILIIQSKNSILFDTYGFNIDNYFGDNWRYFNDCKNEFTKAPTKNIKNTTNGSAKKTLISSGSKNRIPFSPRNTNQKEEQRSTGLKRNLDSDLNKAVDLMEQNFQKGLQKETLHSTMIDLENDIPMDLHTPNNGITFRRKELRRRSKSCELLRPRIKINKVETSASSSSRPIIETIIKRPPFLP